MSKYNGFYDSTLDDYGNPDRIFTAKQFCKHLKGLIGNGIGISNATGDDAWKVEQIENEELKVKVILGNNNYNFASVNGNPFAVDEELDFELTAGADRWDAIMIRADATSTVRETDVKVVEGSTDLIRTEDVYDLRIARVHIENNIITEIIDDRFNNEYCGIAAGLATVNGDDILTQIQAELEAIESGSLVALKNGVLQTNLNAEMLCGLKKEDFENLTGVYNLPTYEHEGDLLIRDYFRKRFSNPLSNSSMFDAISNGKQILFSNRDEVAMYDYKTNSAVKVRGRRSNYDINLLTYEHDTFFIKDSGTSSSAGNRIEYYEPSMGAFQPISVQANIFVKDIAFNGTTYVIACDDGMYYLDGYPQVQTWVKALAVNYMQGVTYANNCFLATGNGGTYKSLNGIEWQKISNNGTSVYGQDGGLKYINNTYIAFNTYSADDGITWQTVPKTGYGLTYINGLWVNTKGYSDSIDNTEWHDLNIPYYYKYNIVPCYNKLIALDANELAEFIPTYSTTNIILNKPLSEYTTNMRVLIDLKDMSFGETTNININGLGNKKLNCTKYDLMCMKSELIYNGEKFNVNNLFLE